MDDYKTKVIKIAQGAVEHLLKFGLRYDIHKEMAVELLKCFDKALRQPANPSFVEYQNALQDVEIWKRRALDAEERLKNTSPVAPTKHDQIDAHPKNISYPDDEYDRDTFINERGNEFFINDDGDAIRLYELDYSKFGVEGNPHNIRRNTLSMLAKLSILSKLKQPKQKRVG